MKFHRTVEDIAESWSQAVPNGIINKDNPYHVVILEGVLDKFDLTREQKLRILNHIRGITEVEKTEFPGITKTGKVVYFKSKENQQ